MPKEYRKKPVVIEAMEYTGDNSHEVAQWSGASIEALLIKRNDGAVPVEMYINTLEGRMKISPGDFVIKGVQGEFYPCKPEIFWATYEAELELDPIPWP